MTQNWELTEQKNLLLSLSTRELCRRFTLDQMQRATSNFHKELVIGKGGFGNVYKGTFQVGPTVVAIKRLHSMSSQGPLEFLTEIEMLSKLRHSHLVCLIGYCDDGYEMILVYEFMPGGTLADHLYKRVRKGHKSAPTLSWVQRLRVCIGAARGLDYLHTGTGIQHRIIHRDVKTTNILLDENLAAKISDFGLSEISPANQATTFVSTHVKGTPGYLDPYYVSTRRLTEKSDVYSFGVVLFVVLCGRPAVDRTLDGEQMGLAGWAQHCFREGLLGNIIDPKIKEEVFPDCLEAFVKVAIQCLHFGPKHRPNMAEVVVALESALVLQEKSTDYSLPEVITSDDNQDDIDFSKPEVESADSEKEMVVVSRGSHQGKQSSTRMTFRKRFSVFLSHAARALSEMRSITYASILRIIRKRKIIGSTLPEETGDDEITTIESLQFDLGTIEAATNNFSPCNKIGAGGFGDVFKGVLSNGQQIAVKRLSKSSGQGAREFQNEVVLVAKLQHRNLVQLLGFCQQADEKILIYEYIPNKSLDIILFDPERQRQLDWSKRYKIIGGIARGLLYLHEDSLLRIIHRDLKASNILLDKDMNAKISDFGNARILGGEQTHGSTDRIVGTYGYMSPEYAMHGQFSSKSDVFSFGVLVLEIISGKKNNSIYQSYPAEDILSYAWRQWKKGTPLELMDPTLSDSYLTAEVIKCFQIGLLCVQEDVDARPSMPSVLTMLTSHSVSVALPKQPAFYYYTKSGSQPSEGLISDQSTSKSTNISVDDVSITGVYAR